MTNKYLLIFIFFLILYGKTLLPSYGFWDIGEMQTVVYTWDIPLANPRLSIKPAGNIFQIVKIN